MSGIGDVTYCVEPCELCEEGTALLQPHGKIEFPHGLGDDQVELTAVGPVWTCHTCGGCYTGEGAEELMHEAVCDHLGRLRPSQIRKIRKSLGMTQRAFSEFSEIGLASIKRWESGTQIQSKIYDGVLRYHLSALGMEPTTVIYPAPTFQTVLGADRYKAAEHFELAA